MEIWKDVKGYEGLYKVSNLGNVLSLKCNKTKLLKPGLNTGGYYQVGLSLDKKVKSCLVSRLVAIAFISNPENKKTVNHKWGNILDNRACELEWMTHSENHLHAYRVLGRAYYSLGVGKKKQVNQYSKSNQLIQIFESITEAAIITGTCRQNISHACNGIYKTIGGFIWRYAD